MQLPADSPAIVIITQHMPPGFTKSFAEWLNGLGQITVKEAAHGDRLMPGTAYIAPGGLHLSAIAAGAVHEVIALPGIARRVLDHLGRASVVPGAVSRSSA